MAVLLDTSYLVDFWRGHEGAVNLRENWKLAGEPVLISSIVIAEFIAGRSDPQKDLLALQRAAQILHFTMEDANAAAGIARKLLQRGEFPGWPDVLIAGQAANRGGIPIVTANPKHFPESKTITY